MDKMFAFPLLTIGGCLIGVGLSKNLYISILGVFLVLIAMIIRFKWK